MLFEGKFSIIYWRSSKGDEKFMSKNTESNTEIFFCLFYEHFYCWVQGYFFLLSFSVSFSFVSASIEICVLFNESRFTNWLWQSLELICTTCFEVENCWFLFVDKIISSCNCIDCDGEKVEGFVDLLQVELRHFHNIWRGLSTIFLM